jgi:hypothetical protein
MIELVLEAVMGGIGLIVGILCFIVLVSMIKKNKIALLVPFLQPGNFISDIKMLLIALICGEFAMISYTIFLILDKLSLVIITTGIPGLIAIVLGFVVMFRWARRFRL